MEKSSPAAFGQRFIPAAIWLLAVPAGIVGAIGASRFGVWFSALGWLLFFAAFLISVAAFIIRLPRIGLGSRRVALLAGSLSFLAVLAGAAIWQATLTPAERLANAERRAAEDATRAATAEQARLADGAAKAEASAWAATRAEQKKVAAALYPPSPCADATGSRAIVEAREVVRARLKNPRGARFSPAWETAVSTTGVCAFTVIGWVDATNGFGAVIRSRFGVDLDARGGDWAATAVLIE